MTTTHMHSLTSALTLSCSIALGLVSLACDTSLDAQRDALSAEGDAQLFDDDEAFLEEAFFAGALDTLVAPTQAAASGEAFAAITQQIVLAEQDLAYIEIVTLASNPHLLVADYVTVPSGHTLLSLSEDVNARACPPGGTTCKQRWDIWLDTSEVCDLDGAYELGLTVDCAPGADCSALDPAFVEFKVPFTLDSEYFCDGVEVSCPEYVAGLSACSETCPCVEEGQGDCDSDDECLGDLVCVHNVGAQYGMPASWDVCLLPA